MRRQDLGLTQTSRQLRTEYLPIYSSHAKTTLSLKDTLEFIKMLETTQEPPLLPSGSVTVDNASSLSCMCGQISRHTHPNVDSSPLIRLCAIYPGFDTKLRIADQDVSHIVAAMCNVRGNTRWAQVFEHNVLDIRVYLEPTNFMCYGYVQALITVLRESADRYLERGECVVGKGAKGGKGNERAWLSAAGLGNLAAEDQLRWRYVRFD